MKSARWPRRSDMNASCRSPGKPVRVVVVRGVRRPLDGVPAVGVDDPDVLVRPGPPAVQRDPLPVVRDGGTRVAPRLAGDGRLRSGRLAAGVDGTLQMLLAIARPANASFVPSREMASCFTQPSPAPPKFAISSGLPTVVPFAGEIRRRKRPAWKSSGQAGVGDGGAVGSPDGVVALPVPLAHLDEVFPSASTIQISAAVRL